MDQILKAFTGLVLLFVNFFLCISVVIACEKRVDADEFKSFVVSELENSNFNDNVISACKNQAQENGYELVIDKAVYDQENDMILANVKLNYTYVIPLLGLNETKMVQGVAR